MDNNSLYLECYSGISGDMTVAALLDLGADEKTLLEGLSSLQVGGYHIKIYDILKMGIKSKKFDVIPDVFHDHDHNWDEHHHHRNINDIFSIIENSQISSNAKDISRKIFQVVAQAESKVHGQPIDKVHFHEVGAVDSIIDIVATAICIDNLGIDQVVVSPLYEGVGYAKCQHGLMPVPVPAVVEIVSNHNLYLNMTGNKGEMITPTGAAIAAALKSREKLPENYTIKNIGIGAGTKEFQHANVLRALIIQETELPEVGDDEMIMLSCNLDDITGEELGYGMEKLFEGGAADVFYTPVYMKKNRPAVILSVLCKSADTTKIKKLIFKHTTTFGIREQVFKRTILNRDFETFKSSLGEVTIKTGVYGDITKKTIEYEDVKKISQKLDMPVHEIFMKISGELSRC